MSCQPSFWIGYALASACWFVVLVATIIYYRTKP